MNFKLKAIVVAALAATSLNASAAYDNFSTGNSGLVLVMLDSTAKVSVLFDLGLDFNGIKTKTDFQSWNLTSGDYSAAWSSFSAAVGGDFSNTTWGVFAGDSSTTFGTNGSGRQLVTTSFTTPTTVSLQNAQLNAGFANVQNVLNESNSSGGNHQAVANGADFATFANSGAAYVGNQFAGNKFGGSNIIALASVLTNSTANLYSYSATSTANNTTQATKAILNTDLTINKLVINASTGTLTYGTQAVAVVPEADTSAMLIAGLGLMGAFARRRSV